MPADPSPATGFFDEARTALATYQAEPAAVDNWARLLKELRAASAVIATLPRAQPAAPIVIAARELIRAVSAAGVHDVTVEPEDLERAQAGSAKGWPGVLAAMLLTPAWQWCKAPALSTVPDWLGGDYTAWLFATPQGFTARGHADAYAAHVLRRLEELVQRVDRNPGATVARAALEAYVRHATGIPLYFHGNNLRRHAELRARLLARWLGRVADDGELPAAPRTGRRLRVGFVSRHFGSQTETYTTLPTFEQLDPERFEVILFAHHGNASPLENYCRSRVREFHLLPKDLGGQLALLRGAQLDVVVFGTNVTAVCHEVTWLALHRVAPLQVVNNSSCITSGFPAIDLYVSGTLTETAEAAGQFTERLGLLPGPAHAFNYEADRRAATGQWTRAALGLPEDATVFVSAANYFKIIPEMQHTWARLLAAVPGSYLLVHPFNPNWSSTYPIQRFCAEFDRVLAAHGVAPTRLVVSSVRFPSRSDVKELLRVGDIYLDTFPFGGVNSLIDPLEVGVPVVAWEGASFRSRMGAALLRSLGRPELIASDEAGYLAIAMALAADRDCRVRLGGLVRDQLGRMPVFLDPLAASEAFGALLETAFDELVAKGRAAFRRDRAPLLAPVPAETGATLMEGEKFFEQGNAEEAAACARSVLGAEPALPRARHLLGRTLLARGHAGRAAAYLLAAVQHVDRDADLWHDLARALQQNRQLPQALQAAEACLKIDPRHVAGWLLIAELAADAGHAAFFNEALSNLRGLAPADPRVAVLARRPISVRAQPGAAATAKHILLYTDDPEFGGVAQYNHNLLLALARNGYRVSCVQSRSDSPLVREQQAHGIRHHWLDYHTSRDFARTLDDASHAERIFRADRPDLVLFSDCCPLSNLAARQAAMTHGIPYVVVVGFVGAYLAKNFSNRLGALARQHAQARAVVAVSRENLQLLHGLFGTPAAQGEVIHYGRPPRFFASRDAGTRTRLRAELAIPDDAVVCFTAARLTAVKGFGYQLHAIQQLQRSPVAQKLYFVWAGDGDQRADLEKEIARSGLGERIKLLGHRWDVADWYDAADIFVLPSQLEGMPLAIMEAMAKGLPVIATAVSGIPEELGDTGKLLPNPLNDAEGVVRGLIATLEAWTKNPELRHAEGRRGRERAEKMFREETMITKTLGVIERALSGRPSQTVSTVTPASQAVEARALLAKGDFTRAFALAKTALAADPRAVDALAVIGEIAQLREESALAEKAFRQAHELAPRDVQISAGLGEALVGQGKLREAEAILNKVSTNSPTEARVWLALARLREAQGNHPAAVAVLEQAVRLHPGASGILLRLGHALKKSGRLLDAVTAHRRALGVDEPLPVVDPATRPVRVAFIVQYPQGWTSLKSVWAALAADANFIPLIIACPNKPPHQVEGGSDAIYAFLESQGVPFTRWNEFPLERNFADIVFFQLPYDVTRTPALSVPEIFKLVPRLAYVPYALEIGGGTENVNLLLNLPLHQYAWAVFARSARHKAAFAQRCASGAEHVIVTGHPKMDALRNLETVRDAELERFIAGRRMVLWNPHYDVRPNGTPFGAGYATFLRWWKFLPEEFARRPDLALVMRPHPLFFDTLVQRRVMTQAEIDGFLARCAAAGNIHIDRRPSYLPVFAASAAIMSDASSFILEYGATGRPLLYLHNPHGPGLNEDGEFVRDHCATAQDEAAIVRFLDDVAAGRDPRGDTRRAAYATFMQPAPEGVGQAIKRAIEERLAAEAKMLNPQEAMATA